MLSLLLEWPEQYAWDKVRGRFVRRRSAAPSLTAHTTCPFDFIIMFRG